MFTIVSSTFFIILLPFLHQFPFAEGQKKSVIMKVLSFSHAIITFKLLIMPENPTFECPDFGDQVIRKLLYCQKLYGDLRCHITIGAYSIVYHFC